MAEKVAERAGEQVQAQEPPKFRRRVGTKETVGFIMWEAAREVPVTPNQEWTDRILAIDRIQQAFWTLPMAVWDMVNDMFLAAFAEKTRTRFGKFRPWLLAYPLYGLPLDLFLLALPYIFWNTAGNYMPKILAWIILAVFNDLTNTIAEISRVGMMANITPDPRERVSLITKAKFLSFGSNLPQQIFRIVRDVVSRNTQYTPLQVNFNMRRIYSWFGVLTMLLGSGLALFFLIVTKERVVGSNAGEDKPPTLRESLVALKDNQPMLMLMLYDILDRFTLDSMYGDYVNTILNFSNFGTVFGIPGGIISPLSYAYVRPLRERFSTKTLWILSQNIHRPMFILIYFFGMIRLRTPVKSPGGAHDYYRMYARLGPMIGIYALKDMAHMSMYGTKQVIPEEIRNEIIDYGEWRSGFRSEAMVGTLRGIPIKIARLFGNFIQTLISALIGFQIGEDYLNQPPRTADAIFAMSTIIPTFFTVISLIPMLFYKLNQKDRARMYAELAERRHKAFEAAKQLNRELEAQYEQKQGDGE